MPVDDKALLQAAIMLAEVEEMRVTVNYTFTAAAATTIAATGGFFLLGPAGIALGSSVAGLGAYAYTKNKFKPVFAILKEDLRPQQQQELINLLKKAFENFDPMDLMKLCVLMVSKQDIWAMMREIVMTYMVQYFMIELSEKNVKVEVKEMTELEKYQKFTEEFKREHGIYGVCPQAIEARASAAAPGWRPDVAAAPTRAASTMPDNSSEEDARLPAMPKTALKTTF